MGGGKQDLSEAARDAEAMGAPDEVIASLRESQNDGFEVFAENWDALEAFLFVSTQWRCIVLGGGMVGGQVIYQGFDYAAVAAALTGAGFAATRALWDDLRVMEAAARDALNGIKVFEQ